MKYYQRIIITLYYCIFLFLSFASYAYSEAVDFETIKQKSIAINFGEAIEYTGAVSGQNYYFSFNLSSEDIPDSNTIYAEITHNYSAIECYTESGSFMNSNGGNTDFNAIRTVYYGFLTAGKKYCTLTELKYDGTFTFAVGQKDVPASKTTTISGSVPDAPVLSVSVNGNNLTLSWTEINNTDEYILLYAPYPYTGPETIKQISMASQLTAVYELPQGVSYYVAITAKNHVGSSDYSNIELFSIE